MINKLKIIGKDTKYEFGGAGGETYKSFDIELDYNFVASDEEYFRVYFDFDYIESSNGLVDWTKPVIIDLMAEDGFIAKKRISLIATPSESIIMKGLGQRNELLNIDSFFDMAFLSNQDSVNFILLSVEKYNEQGQTIIHDILGGGSGNPYFTKARIHYVPVNEYSVFLEVEV